MRNNSSQDSIAVATTAAEAAESRRSIRHYQSATIPESDLRELVRLAGKAPSAFNVQPWRFVVVQDDEVKRALSQAAMGQQQIVRAPATIVVYSDMVSALDRLPEAMHPDMDEDKRIAGMDRFRAGFSGQSEDERESWGSAQSYIAVGYLLLLAESFGYGTSPMLGFDPEQVKALLGLPAHVRIPALVAIGLPGEEGFRPHRLPADTIVEFR